MTLTRHRRIAGMCVTMLWVAWFCNLGLPAHADPTELVSPPKLYQPICHYLDRGFDDHRPGLADRYSITPHGPRTLADLSHIELGLDLPVSHCERQSHSVPCSDHDDPERWCVRRVALSVLGFDLYDESKPDGCLLWPRAGVGGTRTLGSHELRNHPLWGFGEDELGTLISGFDPVTGSFNFPSIRFSAGYLSRLIEGVVGEQLASYVKGCANKLYCGNRRGRVLDGDILPFWTRADDVDCDFGDCPDLAQRRSSPWLELRGKEDHLEVDFDIELDFGLPNLDDHAKYGTEVLPYYGSTYEQALRGSIGFDLGFECRRLVATDEGKLPLCSEAPDEPCFQPAQAINATTGTVQCPDSEEHPLCGETVPYDRANDLRAAIGEMAFEAESGDLIDAVLGALCGLFESKGLDEYCSLDQLGTSKLGGLIDTATLEPLLLEGLDSCPDITIEPDGAVKIDFTGSGGLVFETAGTTGSGTSAKIPAGGGLVGAKDRIGDRDVGGDGKGDRRPEGLVPTRKITGLAGLLRDKTAGAAEAARAAKFSMVELDFALRLLCALSEGCPGIDIATLDPDDLANLDPNELAKMTPAELLVALDPILSNEAIRKCIGGDSDPLTPLEVFAWYTTEFLPAFNSGRCANLRIEKLIPLVGLELVLETAEGPVGDTFAFVDFGYWTQALQDEYGCLGQIVYPPSNAPVCDQGKIAKGPEDTEGMACGTVPGGPCHDLRESHPEWNRQYPEDPAFHPNGDYRWFTRCGNDFESGREMVCVAEYYSGAGLNLTGTCKICGEPGLDEDPFLYTTLGCRPEDLQVEPPCPQGQFLGTNGRCWDLDAGLPEWECEADCGPIFNDYGWCVHHGPWRSWMETEHPYFDANPSSYLHPICAEHTSCTQSGVPCAAQGKMCQPDTETCAVECTQPSHCQAQSPAPAYPEGFVCHPENTCRL